MLTQAQKDQFNLTRPAGTENPPGDIISKKVGVLIAKYDFAKMGGAVGNISLVEDLTSLTSLAKLPANAVIKQVTIDILTAMTSTGGTGTIALKAQSAGDLLAAVDADTISGLVAGVPVGTAATMIKLTAERTIIASVAVAALLTGKFNVVIEYYISE
jgi:hypothetical protein